MMTPVTDVIMPIRELKAALPRGKRLLGLDIGSKTIGLALSDTTLTIATPMETIKRTKFKNDVARLKEIVEAQGVGGFVLGWPVNMDGTEGPRCQSTLSFSENLAGVIDLPQALWDERLSTAAVERTLIEADRSRARRKELVDKMAAAYILQGALHAL
ncbi:Holliday junction resolvase RuvX [Kordiimonas marina]|uniref:Holliday junction resolvase RuvX n=1 Tax=Kordiimonas marina TaxID=2872312 RepID=UPI001FF4AA95|nr:Holliday junction resolvase RuvX [Kordiimonas marina]